MTDTTPGCGSNTDARKRAAEQAGSAPDDREALVRWLNTHGDGGIWEEFSAKHCEQFATDFLTSDWLAEYVAQVRRETAEQIAQAIEALRDAEWIPNRSHWLARGMTLAANIARQSVEGGGER